MSIGTILQVAGLVLEVIGVVAMSFGYLEVATRRAMPGVFLSALWRGDLARGAARSDLNADNRLRTLQGLALIGVGFTLQTAGTLILAFS